MSSNSQSAVAATAQSDQDLERRVGRGGILLTASKFWFLVSGYLIQGVLSRIMARGVGDVKGQELYGLYSVATSFAAVFNALVYQGTTQAVAQFVGRAPENHRAVRRAALRLQTMVGGGLFLACFFGAPLIARHFFDDERLTNPLRYASLILICYAFYAVTMGTFTGTQQFKRQAIVDLSYSTLKFLCIAGFAWLLGKAIGWPEAGVAGFAFASFSVLVMSVLMAPKGAPPTRTVTVRELFGFQAFTMILNVLVTLVTQLDLNLLQKLASGDAATRAVLAGQYRAAQLFATVPYSAVFAITFVLFPLVSGAAGRDPEKLKGYVRQTTRYALVIALMIASVVTAAPGRAVGLLYAAEYEAPAAAPLAILVLGYVAFSVFFIMSSIMTASGRPRTSAVLVGVVAVVQASLGFWLVPRYGTVGAASATAIAMGVGFIVAQARLQTVFGSGVDLGVAARALVSAGGAWAVTHVLLGRPTVFGFSGLLSGFSSPLVAKAMTVAGFGLGVLVFVILLFVTGVFTAEDRARFGRVLGRKKAHA